MLLSFLSRLLTLKSPITKTYLSNVLPISSRVEDNVSQKLSIQWSPSYAATGELEKWLHIRGVAAGEGETYET